MQFVGINVLALEEILLEMDINTMAPVVFSLRLNALKRLVEE